MAEQIAEQLLKALNSDCNEANRSTTANLKQWNDELEKNLLSAASIPKFTDEDPTSSSLLLNEAANKLHASLIEAVGSSISSDDEWCSRNTVDSLVESLDSNRNNEQYFTFLTELLRSAGLFMRWYQTLQSTLGSTDNPTTKLKSEGMLMMCTKLIEFDLSTDMPDVPRFGSIYLFRATYGNDAVTTTARKTFAEKLDGCNCLMIALLKGGQPLPRVFSLVRNVHHLISAHPSSIAKMDKAVELLTKDVPQENNTKHDLLEVLVATMSWAFRSEPAFPGDGSDRRADLVLEILRALFALDAGVSSRSQYSENTMTHIGILLCELFKLPNSDARVYECKLAAVALLLNAPKEYAGYLAENGGIRPLTDIMAYQLALVVVERTDSGAEDAAAVVPILLVLQKLAQANGTALHVVKEAVFPSDAEEAFQEKVKSEMINQKGQVKAKNMAPLDAPYGTTRWKLIRLMTWTESNVKRAGCELLWTLCDDDPTQFVLRTGFGNAVHFLGIKGCVALPEGVET